MNRILILIATYNGERYLQEQLDSVYAQKDVEISILVRDDGSSDNTIKILKDNELEHGIKWYQGGHLGVKFGFYELMEKAMDYDCDYIAFCDQDDVWDEDKLSIAVNKLSSYESKPSLYYCGQRLVDGELNFITEHSLNSDRSIYARFLLNDAAGCTEVFNKALLREILTYKPEYMLMHDTWILKVCLGIGGHVYVDTDAHMSYRQHGNNVVGLDRSILAKIKQAKYYIYEQDVERQMVELKKGYADKLTSEYKNIVDDVLNYKKDSASKKRLLDKEKFYYGDRGLQMVYKLKVLMQKL